MACWPRGGAAAALWEDLGLDPEHFGTLLWGRGCCGTFWRTGRCLNRSVDEGRSSVPTGAGNSPGIGCSRGPHAAGRPVGPWMLACGAAEPQRGAL